MKSQVFQFVFRDVGMGTGHCQVEIQLHDMDRLVIILTESGQTRLGSIRSAFDLVATQLYAKRLAQSTDPDQVTWIYRKSQAHEGTQLNSDEKIDLSWDGERFITEGPMTWLGRHALDAIRASGLSALSSG